jgi:hypothetical protein
MERHLGELEHAAFKSAKLNISPHRALPQTSRLS